MHPSITLDILHTYPGANVDKFILEKETFTTAIEFGKYSSSMLVTGHFVIWRCDIIAKKVVNGTSDLLDFI